MAYDMNLTDEGGTSPAFERDDSSVHSTPTTSSQPEVPADDDVVHICKTCMTARPDGASACGECGEPLVPIRSVQDSYLGETVGDKYKLVEEIGSGGMGDVYLGINEPLDQRVAVKFLSQKYSANEQVIMRFLNEARSYCRVNHPNAVTLLDYGQHDDGALYIITEYVEGISLTDAITEHGPLEPEKALSVTRQCCEVLEAAHGEGVIHRDLKPDNIMLMPASRGRYAVKVLDFGIAKIIDDERGLTKTGSVFGTPEFMSPEQAQGETADPRSDLYALGIILFYTSTAKLPFEAESQFSVLEQQINEAPPKASSVVESIDVPPPIERIIECSLSKSRDQRFDDAEQMLQAIEEAARRVVDSDTSPTLGERAGRTDGDQRTIELTDIVGDDGGADTHGYPAGGGGVDGRADTPLASDIADLDPDVEVSADLSDFDIGGERREEPFELSSANRDRRPLVGAVMALALTAAIVGWQFWSAGGSSPSGGTSPAAAAPADAGLSTAEREAKKRLSEINGWLDEATVARAERTLQTLDGEVAGSAALQPKLSETKKRLEKVSSARGKFVAAVDGDCERAEKVGGELTSVAPDVSDWVDRKIEECRKQYGGPSGSSAARARNQADEESAPAADPSEPSAEAPEPSTDEPKPSSEEPASSGGAESGAAEPAPGEDDTAHATGGPSGSSSSDGGSGASAESDEASGDASDGEAEQGADNPPPAKTEPEEKTTSETEPNTAPNDAPADSTSGGAESSSNEDDGTALPPREL